MQKSSQKGLSDLKQQQRVSQQHLGVIDQKMSNLSDRMTGVHNAVQDLSGHIKQMQYAQQAARRAAVARRARARRMRLQRIRRAKRYYVQAVIPGRAWLKGADGSALTITVGSTIPGYGKVRSIDPYSGIVSISSGIKLYYAVNNE